MTRRVAVLSCIAVLALSACTSESGGSAEPSLSTTTTTVATTAPPTTTAAPPPTTKKPVPPKKTLQEGAPCPYLETDFIALTAGQQISQTNVYVTTPKEGPLPQCDFLRSSGEAVASIRTVTKADAIAAQNAAIAVAPDGNPVEGIGDGGVVKVNVGQNSTVLAISKGVVVVVVKINQESSLEAKDIAAEVVKKF